MSPAANASANRKKRLGLNRGGTLVALALLPSLGGCAQGFQNSAAVDPQTSQLVEQLRDLRQQVKKTEDDNVRLRKAIEKICIQHQDGSKGVIVRDPEAPCESLL